VKKFRRNHSVVKTQRFLEALPQKAILAGRAQSFAEAHYMANLMRSRIRVKSGVARSTIRVENHRSREVGAAILAGGTATQKNTRKEFGKPFDYTRAQEFGTSRHWPGLTGTGGLKGALARRARRNSKPKTKQPRMHPGSKPYAFFWPVYRLRRRAMRGAIAKAIGAVFK